MYTKLVAHGTRINNQERIEMHH